MDVVWPLQDAKQRFSELIRAAESDGPQLVSRHGKEVAVVLDIEEYHRLLGQEDDDFKQFLTSGPTLEGLHLERDKSPARPVELG